jgi:trimeric autotransporter adhesin
MRRIDGVVGGVVVATVVGFLKWVGVGAFLLAVWPAIAGADSASIAGSGANSAKVPLESVLRPDGSVDLKKGSSGSLDVRGYRMAAGPNGEPRFLPAVSAVAGPIPPNPPGPESDPSDVYWDDQFGICGTDGEVNAAVIDSSGKLYVGGYFSIAGTAVTRNIAMWDGSTWSALGSGVNNSVCALTLSGDLLYAGGYFTTAGGVSANYVAKWDGSSWSALGSGMNDDVCALAASGDILYAGGNFTTAGGVGANRVAKWDGSSWSALGSGMNDSVYDSVQALALSGDALYAGGYFTTAGGISANHVAKWDGSSWSALGSGTNGTVIALAVSGDVLYAGGWISMAGGVSANRIAKWDGTSWSALGSGMDYTVYALTVREDVLYAGGDFRTAGGVSAYGVAKWDGSCWSALGIGVFSARTLATNGNTVYAGGSFSHTESGVSANNVAKWDGVSWSALGSGRGLRDLRVEALAVTGNALFAGGIFTWAGDIIADSIAKWDGSTWTGLGRLMQGYVIALAANETGVYAGGSFTVAGYIDDIAKWDGASWSALGIGMNGWVGALAMSGDVLYAGGDFTTAGGVSASKIARWDGSSWSALGSGMNNPVRALALSGDALYAGGEFTSAGGVSANHGAKWDGSSWSALGSGMNGHVYALAVSRDVLYAGGSFTTAGGVSANRVAKWDGSSWSALGSAMNGSVYALAVSRDVLYAGGSFTTAGGVSANGVAKWDGSSWSALGTGTDSAASALAASGNTLFAGGDFWAAGGKASSHIAIWQPRVNVTTATLSASPGAMTIGDDVYGFYKPALMTGAGTVVTCPAGLPTTVTLDRAAEIHVGGPRVNGAFTLLPSGIGFGGDGAVLRVEFSEDDVTSYPGTTYTDFRAANLTYPPNYPANNEAATVTALGLDTAVPIRIENGRQIYAITVPIAETGSACGAVPKSYAPMADLTLAKISLPETAYQTQQVIYRLTIANTETSYGPPDTAHNVIVTDDLPPEAAFVSASASQGSVSFTDGMVTALLGTLESGSVATIDIVTDAIAAGTAENLALVCADEPDPAADNNLARAPTTILPVADLAIEKGATSETVHTGDTIVYTITVTNTEASCNSPATAVVVRDALPEGLVFENASASQGTVTHENGIVTALLGTMQTGTMATVEVRAAAATVGDVANTATVSANEADLRPQDNTAGTSVTVLPAVDLVLTRTVQSEPIVEEGELHYTIEVTNTGGPLGVPVTATGVVVTDVLPAGVEFSSATVSQGTVTFTSPAPGAATGRRSASSTPGTLTADIGKLAAGATATVRVVVIALTPGVVLSTATATSTENDVDESNNSTEAPTTIEPGTGPDLSGTWSGIRETCRVTRRGMTCTIQGTLDVANAGDATAGRSSVAFYLGSRPCLTPDATLLKTQRVGQLRVGAHARVSLSAPLPTGQRSLGRYLIAVIDSANAVTEARELNNGAVFGPVH